MCVQVEGIQSAEDRVAIMERRAAFDEDPERFVRQWTDQSELLTEKIERAKFLYPQVTVESPLLFEIAQFCLDVGVDGHRGDIIILKTAKTLAAYEGRTQATSDDIKKAAELTLPHRIRRQPLMEIADNVHVVRKNRIDGSPKV